MIIRTFGIRNTRSDGCFFVTRKRDNFGEAGEKGVSGTVDDGERVGSGENVLDGDSVDGSEMEAIVHLAQI